ncbi:MAG: hypothetical protein JXQ27_17300 [Acidobacteria bacterium]|nr:hypothetical protein [Acidobacteriota bacterium]
MKHETLTLFIRRLFNTFTHGEAGDECPDENILAAWLEDEGMSPAARQRLRRHLYRCPSCLEKALLLRRLAGQEGPLFPRRSASLFQFYPALRPLASALAMVLVVGLLYLGGSSLMRISDQSRMSTPVATPQWDADGPADAAHAIRQSGEADFKGDRPEKSEGDAVLADKETSTSHRTDSPEPAPSAPKSQAEPPAEKEEFAPVLEREDTQPPAATTREALPSSTTVRAKAVTPPPTGNAAREEEAEAPAREARSADLSFAAQPLKPSALAGDEAVGGVANEKKQAGPDSEWITNPHLILRDLCGRIDPVAAPRLAAGDRVFFRIGDAYVEEGICADMQRRIRFLTGPDARSARKELHLPPQWRHVFLREGEDIVLIHTSQVTE